MGSYCLREQVKAVVHEGFDEGKTFIRRYDTKVEYIIRDDEFAECRRAYLSEFVKSTLCDPQR